MALLEGRAESLGGGRAVDADLERVVLSSVAELERPNDAEGPVAVFERGRGLADEVLELVLDARPLRLVEGSEARANVFERELREAAADRGERGGRRRCP